jgi:hypothetical protein
MLKGNMNSMVDDDEPGRVPRVDDVVRFQAGLELFDHLTFGVDQQGLRDKIPELDLPIDDPPCSQ